MLGLAFHKWEGWTGLIFSVFGQCMLAPSMTSFPNLFKFIRFTILPPGSHPPISIICIVLFSQKKEGHHSVNGCGIRHIYLAVYMAYVGKHPEIAWYAANLKSSLVSRRLNEKPPVTGHSLKTTHYFTST